MCCALRPGWGAARAIRRGGRRDQDTAQQKRQPREEAAEVLADSGEHGIDGVSA